MRHENEDDEVSISAPPFIRLSIDGTFSDGSESSECDEHNREDEDTQQLQSTGSDISDQLQTTSSVAKGLRKDHENYKERQRVIIPVLEDWHSRQVLMPVKT